MATTVMHEGWQLRNSDDHGEFFDLALVEGARNVELPALERDELVSLQQTLVAFLALVPE